MNIVLKGENFSFNITSMEDDETKIEEVLEQAMLLTPEVQRAVDAKYGTLAERQARKAAGTAHPMTLEALVARVEMLEKQLIELRKT